MSNGRIYIIKAGYDMKPQRRTYMCATAVGLIVNLTQLGKITEA